MVVIKEEDMADNTFKLVNGDFEVDQSSPYPQPATEGWGWHGAGTFSIDIADGIATIDVVNPGTVPHGVQFYQQNLVVETGATYLLTYKAKADIARTMRLSLESGTDVRFFKVVDVTTDWVEYSVFITPSGGGFTNGKFAFFPGYIYETSVPTTFYLDDVNLELVGYRIDEEAPQILKVDDIVVEQGAEFDPKDGVIVFDILDKTLTNDDLIITGIVDTETLGEYTLTYELSDAQGNLTTVTRMITVVQVEPIE